MILFINEIETHHRIKILVYVITKVTYFAR